MEENNKFNPEEGDISKYNAGDQQSKRVQALLTDLSELNANPLLFYPEIGLHSYEIAMNKCSGIILSTWARLSKKEQEDILKFQEALEDFLTKNQVFLQKKGKDYPHKEYIEIDPYVWKTFKGFKKKYEFKIVELVEIHGMGMVPEEKEKI